jgi:hypothetical protein
MEGKELQNRFQGSVTSVNVATFLRTTAFHLDTLARSDPKRRCKLETRARTASASTLRCRRIHILNSIARRRLPVEPCFERVKICCENASPAKGVR